MGQRGETDSGVVIICAEDVHAQIFNQKQIESGPGSQIDFSETAESRNIGA